MSEHISSGELVLYATDDGTARFHLRVQNGTVWLSQAELARLFQTSVPNVNIHIRNVLAEGELSTEATIKDDLIVQTEGNRQVRRKVRFYNLEMALAVGYRVKSPRGTQFRQWATAHLREYLVKGFVLDDARLKEPNGLDYFDELLQRIREIRASEKRFYQKVRDVFALSVDYKDDVEAASLFFASVQNKMLYAVTKKTAAEIIVERADPNQPNMNLTSFSGHRIRKQDIYVAKNYLHADEIGTLDRLSTMFLDFAALRASQRKELRMEDWRAYVDSFVEFNDYPLLKNAGSVSHERMLKHADVAYAEFDAQRKLAERDAADAQDLRELEELEKESHRIPTSKKT